jgi:hypothetical protein
MSNHGIEKHAMPRGTRMEVPYGRDNSNYSGSAEHERGKEPKGSETNLSHSLSGATANQKMK